MKQFSHAHAETLPQVCGWLEPAVDAGVGDPLGRSAPRSELARVAETLRRVEAQLSHGLEEMPNTRGKLAAGEITLANATAQRGVHPLLHHRRPSVPRLRVANGCACRTNRGRAETRDGALLPGVGFPAALGHGVPRVGICHTLFLR